MTYTFCKKHFESKYSLTSWISFIQYEFQYKIRVLQFYLHTFALWHLNNNNRGIRARQMIFPAIDSHKRRSRRKLENLNSNTRLSKCLLGVSQLLDLSNERGPVVCSRCANRTIETSCRNALILVPKRSDKVNR